MRGVGRVLKPNNLPPSAIWTVSFSSGPGRGRGGAGGSSFPPPQTANAIGKPAEDETEEEPPQTPLPAGRGRGSLADRIAAGNRERGRVPQNPVDAWQPDFGGPSVGRGRVITPPGKPSKPEPAPSSEGMGAPTGPIFLKFTREDGEIGGGEPQGFGWDNPQQTLRRQRLNEENRHALPGRPAARGGGQVPRRVPGQVRVSVPEKHRPTGEEAVKQALGILARRAEEVGNTEGPRGGPFRGRGRGRGRRGGAAAAGRGRGDQRRGRRGEQEDEDGEEDIENKIVEMVLENAFGKPSPADQEELAKYKAKIGEEKWNHAVKDFNHAVEHAFKNALDRRWPDPRMKCLEEAVQTNLTLEFEPEYAMEVFGTNPDIDEKPPLALREFLEEIKPLLLEQFKPLLLQHFKPEFSEDTGIGTEELHEVVLEVLWERLVQDTMERTPYLQKLLHRYAGYGRVTACEEQEELKAVASQLPDNTPHSVKNFADRAVASLQSNPGWRFDNKYVFMKRLVGDVTQFYEEKHLK